MIIVITSTPIAIVPSNPSDQQIVEQPQPVDPQVAAPADTVTNATTSLENIATTHIVQAGETLSIIADRYNITVDALLAENDLINPDIISVGQVLNLPAIPTEQTNSFVILPDSLFVRGPQSIGFNVRDFIAQQPGYIRQATDDVRSSLDNGIEQFDTLDAASIVERVAIENSVDPRLLLAVLEYRAGWLSNVQPLEALLTSPIINLEDSGGIDRTGLYKQLGWVANELSRGYYGYKYNGDTTISFSNGERFLYSPQINAATAAVQYFLSLNSEPVRWQYDIGPNGFYATYNRLFGDPQATVASIPVPPDLQQPILTLPFAAGETWFFTGGPHGGWGSGSGWAAIDFAPPDERPEGSSFCYISESWVRAVAEGVIARSDNGAVVIDLDGDGDERTGWTFFYLHIASVDRVAEGTTVQVGDSIGHASCAGGFSTATHLHVARRYNGEWLPADCSQCAYSAPSFVMDDWVVSLWNNLEYQGFLTRGDEVAQAEQGRDNPINQVQR
ncbi:MAG: LysM peptidoglycan-binding domain-containing protein [Anaerolineaceae bacterium]|nr:LysM peptidoglycan-binding domain-containing protein [Anaerolineaceae bacterium]